MGIMDWLMKGVDEGNEVETENKTFNEQTIENLKNISNSEMQESTTLTSRPMTQQMNVNYNNQQFQNAQMQNQMPNNAYSPNAYGQFNNQPQQYVNNGYQMQQPMNIGTPLMSQNAYVQYAPNQPYSVVNMVIYEVYSCDDIKLALKQLAKHSPCIVSFHKMAKKKMESLFQFLSGGAFALGATLEKWAVNDYVLAPRGMNISRQDRAKRRGK